MGVRRVCRVAGAHGCRVLSLIDNMAVAMSLDRGRAPEYGLNVLAARAAAYQLGCNVNRVIRYIRSEANATDFDSRAADRGEIAPGGVERASARAISRLEGVVRGEDTARRSSRPPPRPLAARRSDPSRKPLFLLLVGAAGGPLSQGAQECGARVEHVVLDSGVAASERWAGGVVRFICRMIQLRKVTHVHLGAVCVVERTAPPGLASPLSLASDLVPIYRIVRACDRAGVGWSLDGVGCHRFGCSRRRRGLSLVSRPF